MSARSNHSADPPFGIGQFVIGASCAIAAVAIWAGWLGLGVTTRLSAPDLTALRFATAGPVLLPVVWRRGLAIDRLGCPGFVAVVLGAGAPVVLLIGAGLQFAPVAHAGALFQGTVRLAVACLAAIVLNERIATIRKAGLVRCVRRLNGCWAGHIKSRRATEHRAPIVSLGDMHVGLLHGRDPTRPYGRPARSGYRGRCFATVLSPRLLSLFRERVIQRADGRFGVSGAVTRRAGGSGFACALWPRDPSLGSVKRGCVRRPWADYGHSEGFETVDLKSTKTLLDALGHAQYVKAVGEWPATRI